MSKFPIIQSSIIDATEDIIAHQTNCHGVMGSGVARYIKEKWPEVYKSYHEYCIGKKTDELLGHVLFCHTTDDKYIANIFGQNDFGTNHRQTNYEALYNGLEKLFNVAKKRNKSVAIPVKIGCGLGGGNWNIVNTMIEEIFNDPNMKVTLYEYQG